jgi:hypothetical protein
MNADKSTSPDLTQTRYGTAHPERVENALWERAMQADW